MESSHTRRRRRRHGLILFRCVPVFASLTKHFETCTQNKYAREFGLEFLIEKQRNIN